MSLKREVGQFIRELERQGYRVKMGGRGHWKVYDGKRLAAVMGATPNDARSMANARANIRRYERSRS